MTTSNRFTRRQFLKTAAAVAVGAPALLPSTVWAAPKAPGYSGPHAVNTRLARLQTLSLGPDEGPEHIALHDG